MWGERVKVWVEEGNSWGDKERRIRGKGLDIGKGVDVCWGSWGWEIRFEVEKGYNGRLGREKWGLDEGEYWRWGMIKRYGWGYF